LARKRALGAFRWEGDHRQHSGVSFNLFLSSQRTLNNFVHSLMTAWAKREWSPLKNCLIVDDSSAIRLVARRILERLGFAVSEAADAETAYEVCARQPLDFIFLDLHLRGGLEFLAYQRTRSADPQPKVLVCTIASDDPLVAGALRAGADDFILKPFDRAVLEGRLVEIGVLAPPQDMEVLAHAAA
jgi:two-component system, chemotaxis family, chemotaxis protein CheY